MKALQCREWGTPEKLVVADLPDPIPGDNEVVLRVHAASVNFPDGLIIQNKYQVKPGLPFVPGAECAGVVETVGPHVTNFKAGDRVIALPTTGAFAEKLCCPADKLVPIPHDLDFTTAAAFIFTYGTAYHALQDRGALKSGETLLVLGAAGGVGIAAIEIGKALGARVIAAASSAEKLETCRTHGADILINYSTEDLKDAIAKHTGGKGVDVVFDPVGGDVTETALRSCAWRGRLLVVGFANGDISRLPSNIPLLKGCSVIGVFWGRYVTTQPADHLRDVATLLAWLKRGTVRPHIWATYPLDRGAAAIAAVLERQVVGKAIILTGAS